MIVSILYFLLIFLIIVVSHEFGHYIVGKMNGIHAAEFFVGVGPKILKKVKDGTEFSLRLLPFGGACVFEGIDDLEESEDSDESEKKEPSEYSEHSFFKASVWSRIATTLAGPVFNVILAYICGVVLASASGVIVPQIQTIMEDSGAEEAGLQPGDVITKINHSSIHLSSEVSFLSFTSDGSPIDVTVLRNGEKIKYTVVPKYSEEDQRYYMGFTSGEFHECDALDSLKYGAYNVQYMLRASYISVKMLFTGRAGKDDLAGPVGMVQMVDETYDEAKEYGALTVVLSMMNLMLILAANLAVINLLPIPGLDGGRLLFLLIEAVRGKPVPREKEGYVTLAGMALLLALVVFVTINDISRFFR